MRQVEAFEVNLCMAFNLISTPGDIPPAMIDPFIVNNIIGDTSANIYDQAISFPDINIVLQPLHAMRSSPSV